MAKIEEITLDFGTIVVRDLGGVRVRSYQSKNPLSETCVMLEKDGEDLAFIESLSFLYNVEDLRRSMASMNKKAAGVIAAYHAVCESFLSGPLRAYSTRETAERFRSEERAAFFAKLSKEFECFDPTVRDVTNLISGKVSLGGLEFVVENQNKDGFDLAIPEINCAYVHMLGADRHSLVDGEKGADSLISSLQSCLDRKFDLIFTSHRHPENLEDAKAKIAYLENLKRLAQKSSSSSDLFEKVRAEYPALTCGHYLRKTAESFFPEAAS